MPANGRVLTYAEVQEAFNNLNFHIQTRSINMQTRTENIKVSTFFIKKIKLNGQYKICSKGGGGEDLTPDDWYSYSYSSAKKILNSYRSHPAIYFNTKDRHYTVSQYRS